MKWQRMNGIERKNGKVGGGEMEVQKALYLGCVTSVCCLWHFANASCGAEAGSA